MGRRRLSAYRSSSWVRPIDVHSIRTRFTGRLEFDVSLHGAGVRITTNPREHRTHRIGQVLLLAAMSLSFGCAKKVADGPTTVGGEKGKPESSLAYEHIVAVSIPEHELRARMTSARGACTDGRFGACSLLRFDESAGDYPSGLLMVRVVPDGVEPFVAFASEGGAVASRTTRAEDLAKAVADTAREAGQLNVQRTKLSEFEQRNDLAVADMLALAREIGSVETQLAELNGASTNLQQRIETNLVTINFSTSVTTSRWSAIGRSASESFDSFADGAAEVVELIAFGLPFLLLMFPLALAWRWLWRRFTSGKPSPAK